MDPYRQGHCADCGAPDTKLVHCPQCSRQHCEPCSRSGLCQACLRDALKATDRLLRLAGASHFRGRRSGFLAAGAQLVAAAALVAMAVMSATMMSRMVAMRPFAPDGRGDGARAKLAVAATGNPWSEGSLAPASFSARPGNPGPADTPSPLLAPNRQSSPLENMAIPWPPALLATSGPQTHLPHELLARARRLRDAGLNLVVVTVALTGPQVESLLQDALRGGSVLPIKNHGEPAGLAFHGFPAGSLPKLIGLKNGDLVTSVNGWPLTSPDQALTAYSHAQADRLAVVEVLREQRRIVLAVSWPGD